MSLVYDINQIKSEDDVENKFVQELFTKILGYNLNDDLKWKETITYKLGRQQVKKIADLVVYKNGNPMIVVEAKSPLESNLAGIAQTDSYAFAKEVRYAVITNGRSLILREYLAANKKINLVDEPISKLIEADFDILKNIISKDLIENESQILTNIENTNSNEITDYRRFFRSIHNIIRNGEKLDPAACFDEFSKILYLKMCDYNYHEEKEERNYFDLKKFKNVPNKTPMELINDWFKLAISKYYHDVFEESPELKVGLQTLERVLEKLDDFYVKDEKMDIKGRAFEEFLPSQLRGKGLGQFFTPRKIVDFMVDLAEVSIKDVIVDFACGSGGFLIKAFAKMNEAISYIPDQTFSMLGTTKEDFMENLKSNQIFGIDAEPRAVRIAKMNMMLWGDGKKIVRGDGLAQKDWYEKEYPILEYNEKTKLGGATLILANPPFIECKEKEILSNYILATNKNSIDAQTLFIERGINLLRPNGRMLIVLPEGILSNDNSIKTREYLLKNCFIRAIVELPTHTFVQSGVDTINTVVLYVEKYSTELKEEINAILTEKADMNIDIIKNKLDYDIFMASAENIGYEPNGRVFIKNGEKTDLDLILEQYRDTSFVNKKTDIVEDSLTKFNINERNFRGQQNMNDCMLINVKNLKYRFDPSYYIFWKNIGSDFDNYVPLSTFDVKILKSNKLKLDNDEALDKEYKLCSVDKNEENNYIAFNKFVTGEDLVSEKQAKKVLRKNTIVYNPYRANIGSFSYVPEELDGAIVSGAYVNFEVKHFNPELLIYLFKTPIYNKYIKVLSTGSVRDNFSEDQLKNILVPNINEMQQNQLLSEIKKHNEEIKATNKEKTKATMNKLNFIYNIYKS